MTKYTSRGTVSYHFSTGSASLQRNLVFIPVKEYTIKHKGEDLAIFVSDDTDRQASLINYKDGINITISADPPSTEIEISSLLFAAQNQLQVEIDIKIEISDDEPQYTLVSITIPAK